MVGSIPAHAARDSELGQGQSLASAAKFRLKRICRPSSRLHLVASYKAIPRS